MNLNKKINPSKFSILLPITIGLMLVYSNYVYLSDTSAGSYVGEDYFFIVKLLPSLVYCILMPFATATYLNNLNPIKNWPFRKKFFLGALLFMLFPLVNEVIYLVFLKYFFKTQLFFSEALGFSSFLLAFILFVFPLGYFIFFHKKHDKKVS